MEEHRLKPMQENYDEKLFNDYYKRTEGLRRKLASEIDCRKFGVDYNEILSWFDIKFIFVFNKYYGDKPDDRLLGYIINALKLYKYRIMRKSYTEQYSIEKVDIEEIYDNEELLIEPNPIKNPKLDKIMNYFKDELSDDAQILLEIQLYPPPYVWQKIKESNKNSVHNIPAHILSSYLLEDDSPKSISYIRELKREINNQIEKSKGLFN